MNDVETHLASCYGRLTSLMQMGSDPSAMVAGFMRGIISFVADSVDVKDIDETMDLLAGDFTACTNAVKEHHNEKR